VPVAGAAPVPADNAGRDAPLASDKATEVGGGFPPHAAIVSLAAQLDLRAVSRPAPRADSSCSLLRSALLGDATTR